MKKIEINLASKTTGKELVITVSVAVLVGLIGTFASASWIMGNAVKPVETGLEEVQTQLKIIQDDNETKQKNILDKIKEIDNKLN